MLWDYKRSRCTGYMNNLSTYIAYAQKYILGAGTLPLETLPLDTDLQTFHKNVPEGVHLYNCTQGGTIHKPIGSYGGMMLVLSRGEGASLKIWFELYIPCDDDNETLSVVWRKMTRMSPDTKEWTQL